MTPGRRADGQAGSETSEPPGGDETESDDPARLPNRPSAHPPIEFCISADHTERLDRFLADQLQLSRTQAARLIADKAVRVDGAVARTSRVLARGARITVAFPSLAPPRQLRPAQIPLTIVWEDEHLAVIDKPAGLVVHPAPGHWDDTLVNALVARGTTLGGAVHGRPGIVHRLDRDTSGLMLVAKTDVAHRRLSQLLGARRIVRAYAALTWGHLAESPTVIEAPLARHPRDRKRMAIVATGRAARTDAHVIARFASTDLLRLELHTGRTHQIRVHLEQTGHPVVGDPVYGGGGSRRISGAARPSADALERATPRQALHAAWLAFRHPLTGAPLEFRSEWPADLGPALRLAAGGDLVARPDPLAYLLFFNRHE